MSVGNRVFLKHRMPDKELLEAFRGIPTANIADVMGRSPAMNPRIRLISSPSKPMVGAALTVKARAGDNLLLHMALDLAGQEDVVVVSNEEDNTRSLMGEIMMVHLAFVRKAAGIVLDGPIRDVDAISKMDFPVYATGATPNGPYKEGPGEVNVPIACGGVSVNPGDIIVADADGVVVIPLEEAPIVLENAKKYHVEDERKCQATKNGLGNRAWVRRLVEQKGIEVIDDYYKT